MRRTREGIGGMTLDQEKKIAEIQKSAEEARKTKGTWVDGQDYADDVEFLLDELERERAELDRLKREIESHGPEGRNYTNQQVVELRLERERLIEENRKLLEERDEARRKAEEAWKEIDSLEEQLLSSQQEIERLRQLYEREREIADQALEQVNNLREERNQDRQWIEKASENVTQLQQERDKMIEWLRMCIFNHGCWHQEDYVAYMRDILKEIGVTVE